MGVFALILSKNTPSYLVGIQYYEKNHEYIFSLFVKLHVGTNEEKLNWMAAESKNRMLSTKLHKTNSRQSYVFYLELYLTKNICLVFHCHILVLNCESEKWKSNKLIGRI